MDVRTEATGAMANTDHILQEAQRWMGSFIEADCKKNSVIQQLLQRLDENQFEMDQLRRDLAAERKSRTNFQVESDRYESEMIRLEQRMVSSWHVPGEDARCLVFYHRPLLPLHRWPGSMPWFPDPAPPAQSRFCSKELAANTVCRTRAPLSRFL